MRITQYTLLIIETGEYRRCQFSQDSVSQYEAEALVNKWNETEMIFCKRTNGKPRFMYTVSEVF